MTSLEYTCRLAQPAAVALAWHVRPGAFVRLCPPGRRCRVVAGVAAPGAGPVGIEVAGPLGRRRWQLDQRWLDGAGFVDEQVRGPFRRWRHEHLVAPVGEGCEWRDRIEYALPRYAAPAAGALRRSIDRAFAWRHRRLAADLERHARFPTVPLRVLVSGASGLVGSALVAHLGTAGHAVIRLLRRPEPGAADAVVWDPRSAAPPPALDGFDAVIHLAGANVGERRWTPAVKAELRASRIASTAALARALAASPRPPATLLVASGTSVYGDRRDEVGEDAAGGDGFLADLVRAWEAAAQPARAAGIRVAHLRLGVVLAADGGALAKMLPAFRLGLGGRLGRGDQPLSWIGLDDAVGAIEHVLHRPLSGPVNVVAGWTPQADFARVLARVLHRPRLAPPIPRWALRLGFGEMADETVLTGAPVRAARLEADGFAFRHRDLAAALREELGR